MIMAHVGQHVSNHLSHVQVSRCILETTATVIKMEF
jgi:hypothetical protein